MDHVPISGTNHSRKRVVICSLARLSSLANGCGQESGESLKNKQCVRTIGGREVQFPEGINE